MRYYTIQNGSLIITESKNILNKFYDNIQKLPDDYVENKYIIKDNKLLLNQDYETQQAKNDEDRINHLVMTALDFIKVLDKFGFTITDRQQYFSEHPEVQEQLMYCQKVYCGVVRQFCPITVNNKTITDNIIVQAFKDKNIVN